MSAPAVLVAGIGNIFLGDDGFGVEVAQRLADRRWPGDVKVVDFGIRGFDLAFAMLDEPGATILVDAMPRGSAPGTVYVLEPTLDDSGAPGTSPDHGQGSFEGHAMTPDAVFGLVRMLGGRPTNVLVVGCEPLTFGPENIGQMGLSDPVAAAIPEAVDTVEQLVARLLAARATTDVEAKEEMV